MDYILTNAIIYGYLALLLSSIFAFKKYVNFAVGGIFILLTYLIHEFVNNSINLDFILIFSSIIVVYFGVDYLIYNSFRDPQKRELFSIVFSLGLLSFIENTLAFFKGPSTIGVSEVSISTTVIIAIFILFNIAIIYILRFSFAGKVFKATNENAKIVNSLGININKFLFPYFTFLLIIGLFISYIYITGNTMRPTDGVFFLLKAIGIMVLVGITKIEYIFIASLLYVLLEYFLFINIGIPVTYKESLILLIILIILILKPEGIFSFKKRKI